MSFARIVGLLRTARSPHPDGDLLAQYAATRDETAFAELVRRHGPLVLTVCRRVLRDDAAAEDAFQVTFLILARKAGSIRHPGQLANWLFGVADRVARTARRATARRRAAEANFTPRPSAMDPATDWAGVVHEEIARLAGHYRTAVVLCDLQGLTLRDAAERIGIPPSTLSNRLRRARETLGRRLVRRGVTLGSGTMIGAIPDRLTACSRPELASPTVRELLAAVSGPTVPIRALAGVATLVIGGLLWATAHTPVPPDSPKAPPVVAQKPPQLNAPVTAIQYFPDGKRVAVGVSTHPYTKIDNLVLVYDATTWQELYRRNLKLDRLGGFVLSPDGKTLYTASDRDNIVADRMDGRPPKSFDTVGRKLPEWVSGPTISPDGRVLATSHFTPVHVDKDGKRLNSQEHLTQLWDTTTAKLGREISTSESSGVPVFSHDGQRFSLPLRKENQNLGAAEFDTTTGKQLRVLQSWERDDEKRKAVYGPLVYSPDGKWLLTGGGSITYEKPNIGTMNGSVYGWAVADGKCPLNIWAPHDDYVRSLAFAPDGRRLFGVGHGGWQSFVTEDGLIGSQRMDALICWEFPRGRAKWTVTGISGSQTIAVSPDGETVLVSFQDGVYAVRVSDGKKGVPVIRTQPQPAINAVKK